MKIHIKILIGLLLSFSVVFSGIGYAALTDELGITGSVDIDIPSGLFITNIELYSQSNIENQSADKLGYSTTVNCSLNKTSGNSVTGSVTYRVTVYNNTERVYAYRDIYYQDSYDSGYNGNDYISRSNGNNYIGVVVSFDGGDSTVAPGEELTFTVTYTVGSSLSSDTEWNTLINFQFGINVDMPEDALDAISSKFEDILNSSSTYQDIIDKIDDKYDGTAWKATYFGNVSGSNSDDSVAVETLFAGQLQMMINGVEQPVTVMIKRENIDNNVNTGDDYTATYGNQSTSGYGCEYTLYMTIEDLSNPNGYSNMYKTVFATVFTCDRNTDGSLGDWYIIGETYEGTAQVVAYEGGYAPGGSFDTGSWRSVAQTLSPAESYSYSVSANQAISTIITATDDKAKAALQTLLDEAHIIITENKYAGEGMVQLESTYMQMSDIYTVNSSGSPVVNNVARSLLIPYIQKMENGLKMFELSELEAIARLAPNIFEGSNGTETQREALRAAYNAAKAEGLFTDTGGVVSVNDDSSYLTLKTYVDALTAAYDPFS